MQTNTINFFKEICKIPHGTFNEEKIANYLCDFAIKRNLEYYKDRYNNVLIKKKTSNKEPIILQAHTDMVCAKLENKEFDFINNSIEVYEENGFLKAKGTSLGADNGIGVAQILNILDSNNPCNIEALFTVEEEVTMKGASEFDFSMLKGKNLISFDSFEENVITIESASITDIVLKKELHFEKNRFKTMYKISLDGLLGGHSGLDIDKNLGNSLIIMANLLAKIDDINIIDYKGGIDFNVIPSLCSCYLTTALKKQELIHIIEKYLINKKDEFPRLNIKLEKPDFLKSEVLNKKDSKEIIEIVKNIPNGVVFKNKQNEIITSLNLGMFDLFGDNQFKISLRSSNDEKRKETIKTLKDYAKDNNASFLNTGYQPGFSSNKNSKLIKVLEEVADINYYKEKPKLKSVHIGVELGIFQEKMPFVNMALIGANIYNAHSPNECVETASIERLDKWIRRFIERF